MYTFSFPEQADDESLDPYTILETPKYETDALLIYETDPNEKVSYDNTALVYDGDEDPPVAINYGFNYDEDINYEAYDEVTHL